MKNENILADKDDNPKATSTDPVPYRLRPTSLSAVYSGHSPQGGRVKLTWRDNSLNEIIFIIQRKIGLEGDWRGIGIVESNITSYVDKSLLANRAHYYRVQCGRGAMRSAYSNVVSVNVSETGTTRLAHIYADHIRVC